jgi:hypothetical protein
VPKSGYPISNRAKVDLLPAPEQRSQSSHRQRDRRREQQRDRRPPQQQLDEHEPIEQRQHGEEAEEDGQMKRSFITG